MDATYEAIKAEQGLPDGPLRSLFERYCEECRDCTTKIEWSCKLSPGRIWHKDRFVQVSSPSGSPTWLAAGERMLDQMLDAETRRTLEPILLGLRTHARQLFAGFSGGAVVGAGDGERIKLYYALSGESGDLWQQARALIGRTSLEIPAPSVSAWLLVFVLSPGAPPTFRLDLVFDRVEFRDPEFVQALRSFLNSDEIDFIGAEARGIVSLRQAETETIYSYIEHARPDSPNRQLAAGLARVLPAFSAWTDRLTWIGIRRGALSEIESHPTTLYTKISGSGFDGRS